MSQIELDFRSLVMNLKVIKPYDDFSCLGRCIPGWVVDCMLETLTDRPAECDFNLTRGFRRQKVLLFVGLK